MTAGVRGFRVSLFGVAPGRRQRFGRHGGGAGPLRPAVAATRSRSAAEAADRARRGAACRRTASGFEILVDGAVAGAAPSPLAAIPRVQRALDEAVVRRQTDVAVVHGGVVGHDGRAILLPGPTGAGKSTLVAELVRRGRILLLRRVRAHRCRRARAPVPAAPAPAGRAGLTTGPCWRRTWAERWRTSRFRRASSWDCAMPPDALALLRAMSQGEGRVAPPAQHAPGAGRPAVDPGARWSARSGARPATPDCGERPGRRPPRSSAWRHPRAWRCRPVTVRSLLLDLGRLSPGP